MKAIYKDSEFEPKWSQTFHMMPHLCVLLLCTKAVIKFGFPCSCNHYVFYNIANLCKHCILLIFDLYWSITLPQRGWSSSDLMVLKGNLFLSGENVCLNGHYFDFQVWRIRNVLIPALPKFFSLIQERTNSLCDCPPQLKM